MIRKLSRFPRVLSEFVGRLFKLTSGYKPNLRTKLSKDTLPARVILLSLIGVLGFGRVCAAEKETLAEIGARLGKETTETYAASPFSALSKDYFLRFTRDPDAKAESDEVEINSKWRVEIPDDADPLTERMAGHLIEFLDQRMGVSLKLEKRKRDELNRLPPSGKDAEATGFVSQIVLLDSGWSDKLASASFGIRTHKNQIAVLGSDPAGLRDGIVKLVDMIGFREGPFVKIEERDYYPKLSVRLGTIPFMGKAKDLVFLGFNAMVAGGGNLHALSTSDAIPELAARRQKGLLESNVKAATEAREYGLKTYAWLDTRQKYPKDDPVFAAHPDIRGSLTWSADGEYVLCTEHPLVRQYLSESVEGLFRADPKLDGAVVIIGGEGFYHCFMRPYGVKKGHTDCARCEKLGAETVVANLVNMMAESARRVNPKAEIVIWPYSAVHVWSADAEQIGLIEKLKPGVALLTEIEKDEYVEKEGGVRKHLWDYSIDMIGPGERAKKQIAACAKRGIPVYLKSEPELGFEAPRLPNIPCMDRWADRATALATCGATGAWVFPAFRPCYGTIAAEVAKYSWWSSPPSELKEVPALDQLARRLAGTQGAPHVREAWKRVSEAIEYSPELPPYYTGPYYLGPAHPMCADPNAELPEVFSGYYLFMAEMTDAEGMKKRPTYFSKPRGDVPAFLNLYRKMERALKVAADEMDAARPLVEERRRLMFDAEDSPVQWFYRTARTHANFYESCMLRDRLHALAEKSDRTAEEKEKAGADFKRWIEILEDERANTIAALPLMERDPRLDFRYGGDHTFEHGAVMIRAKLKLLDAEISQYIPSLEKKCGL